MEEAKERGGYGAVRGIKELVDEGLDCVPERYVRPPHHRPALHTVCDDAQLPIIDISALHLTGDRRSQVLQAIDHACQHWGFFQVINHGVLKAAIEDLWAAAHRFFSLPAQKRMQYFAGLLAGKQVSYFTSHLPEKEEFSEWKDSLYFRCDPRAPDALDQSPSFCREPVLEYLRQISSVSQVIYEAILENLGLRTDTYSVNGVPQIFPGVIMAIHYYPPCPDPSLTFGQSAHSDITLLTMVLQDEVGGLEVLNEGRWMAVKPVPDSFVINIGDPVQILSNGKYKSVEHRVVLNKEKPRFSVPCFFNPPSEAWIAPLVGEQNSALLYKGCVYGDYAQNALSKGLNGKYPLDFVKV